MSYITYMQNLTKKTNKNLNKKEIIQMNLFTKQKDSHRCKKQNLWLPVRKEGERDKSGNWDYKTGLYIK